jgi:hypothetical protein
VQTSKEPLRYALPKVRLGQELLRHHPPHALVIHGPLEHEHREHIVRIFRTLRAKAGDIEAAQAPTGSAEWRTCQSAAQNAQAQSQHRTLPLTQPQDGLTPPCAEVVPALLGPRGANTLAASCRGDAGDLRTGASAYPAVSSGREAPRRRGDPRRSRCDHALGERGKALRTLGQRADTHLLRKTPARAHLPQARGFASCAVVAAEPPMGCELPAPSGVDPCCVRLLPTDIDLLPHHSRRERPLPWHLPTAELSKAWLTADVICAFTPSTAPTACVDSE